MKPLRAFVAENRRTLTPGEMPEWVDHYSIPALDAGAPEFVESSTIDSHKVHLLGGELLVSRLNPRKPRVHLSPQPLPNPSVASTELVTLRILRGDSRYLRFLMLSEGVRQDLDSKVRSATRSHQRVEPGEILAIPVPVVGTDDQRRIADFLDDRVARIDQIIAARREQFALVEEAQHESMRVTTEGRDRGASWSRPRVAHIFRTGSGSTPPSDRLDYYDGDVPWVNTGDVRDDLLSTTGRTLTRGALADFSTLVRYPVGSMVIAMYGQGATKGRTALLQTTACVNQACCVLQGDPLLLRWAFQWFRAHKADIVELANGAGQPNLSQEIIRNVRLAVPPRDAVEGLLLEIESQQTALAGTRAFVTRQISLLQEYKESLITAAVTGELDVTTAGGGIPG